MTDLLLRMLLGATVGLALALLLRRPARRVFGAGPAFALWLAPPVLALAPLLPRGVIVPSAGWSLPALVVSPHVAFAAAGAGAGFDWAPWLLALWAMGFAFACIRLAWRYARIRRGVSSAPLTWRTAVARAIPGVDPRRVCVHVDGPAVLAAWPRALLLVPPDFDTRFGDAATRELVLRHETTHLARGDAWWSLAMELASALLWFHPLAWLARSRFRLDQELACDAAVLRRAPQCASLYARALLDSVSTRAVPALIPWLTEPQLKERITMLAKRVPGGLRRGTGFLTLAALLGGAILLAGGRAPAAASPVTTGVQPAVDAASKNSQPLAYPEEAAHAGEQGTVMLAVTVDATGKVRGVAVDPHGTDAPAILQQAAMDAARKWTFRAGVHQGRAIGGVVHVPVRFSLQQFGPGSKLPDCAPGFVRKPGTGRTLFTCVPAGSAG